MQHDDDAALGKDAYHALTMYKLWFGNMNDAMFGSDRLELKRRRAIKSDWKLHRMPRTRAHFKLEIPLSDDEFETLAWGHIPEEMEDHWFMYFDGDAFCFHRSWTGYCIFRVYVKRSEDRVGYVLYRVTANRKKEQYGEENDEHDAVLVAIMVGQARGKDVDKLWERWFEMEC